MPEMENIPTMLLCWLQAPGEAQLLILHAASSTTNTVRYSDLYMSTVLPYWQSNPPRYRLSSKPYKAVGANNSYLPEDSLTFKVHWCSDAVSFDSFRQAGSWKNKQ